MQKILISACLLGAKVRYDGEGKPQNASLLDGWLAQGRLVPICPEVAGGLSVPRPPAEIVQGKVLTNTGKDVTSEYRAGAELALNLCQTHQIKIAILKARSPSCGNETIYDGTFTHTQIPGQGVTTELLMQHGIVVFNENQLKMAENFLTQLDTENSHEK